MNGAEITFKLDKLFFSITYVEAQNTKIEKLQKYIKPG